VKLRGLLLLAVIVCPGFVSTLEAQAPQTTTQPPAAPTPQDSFLASWQLDPASFADGSSGLSLDWIRRTTRGPIVTAGGGLFSIANSRWGLGRFGAAVKVSPRVTVQGQTSVGGGSTAGSRFKHLTLRGDLSTQATPRVSVTFGDEYISVAAAHGHLFRAGTAVRVSQRAAVDVTYATSIGGNLNTTFMVARVDHAAAALSVSAGVALGRTTPEIVSLTGTTSGGSQALRQVFAGISRPMGRVDLRVAIDVLRLATVTRSTLTFAVVVPAVR
jgi:hypothetical protein